MQPSDYKNKHIGIWGFGIVGKSVYNYLKQINCNIQIMDTKEQSIPNFILQSPENIKRFLESNDIIIPSPGICVKIYDQYKHKFIAEVDLFEQAYKKQKIAITGSFGKTSITYLLSKCIPNGIAAGNIGFAMLDLITQNIQKTAIIEVSSFQLQESQAFAPDLAIWTNFYPNHLDYHKDEREYFLAKCNILKYQTNNQKALIACNLIERIEKELSVPSQIYLFCDKSCKTMHNYPAYSYDQGNVYLIHDNKKEIIFSDLEKLAPITYKQNWFIVLSAMHLSGYHQDIIALSYTISPQEHRLERITTINNTTFYNDSKSTVWQTTQAAVEVFNGKTCALLLGGMSKGTDRTPLIEYLANKQITVYAFGKEAELLQKLCNAHKVPCYVAKTLHDTMMQIKNNNMHFDIVLLSPAGASFDLFKNYTERGDIFKKLVHEIFT